MYIDHVVQNRKEISMVNYIFATEEQKELVATAREILEAELLPRIEEFESADEGRGVYPMEVHKILAESGYFGMGIPEKWGGLELDIVTQALIIEEMGKIDCGFAFTFAGAGSYFDSILGTSMPDEEKQMWADRIMAGAMGCFAQTEPNAGSDVAAMRTSAVQDGDEWIINGTKCFSSYAPNAEYFIVPAWTDKTQRASKGVTMFFVEKERGVQIGKKENKMGLHLSETSDVIFDDVRVPADHIIGGVGEGFGKALTFLGGSSAMINCAPNLGMAQAALDQSLEYAKERRQFGKRIVDQQAVGFMIADMKMRTEASRAMLYEYLRAKRDGLDCTELEMTIKAFITDATMQTTMDAVQVCGGYGYMKDYPFERYMRNAKIFQIFGGTNQIKRKNLIRRMAGRDPQAVRK